MTWRLIGTVSLALGLGACTPDSDDDGLSNAREEKLGTNPDAADTDHDGLDDGREVKLGTDPKLDDSDGDGLVDGDEIDNGADPLKVDTDDDGYTDRDEVFEGHDPADDRDRIYKGNWPYYFEKDSLKGGAIKPGGARDDKRVGRFQLQDQNGDKVNLFDFYHAGKPVLVDYSGVWCYWCNVMASWIADDGVYAEGPYGYGEWDSQFPGLRQGIVNGDIYFITILNGDAVGNAPTKKDAKDWAKTYDSPMIPILVDKSQESIDYLRQDGWPELMYLDEDLKIQAANPSNWTVAAEAAVAGLTVK